MQKNDAPCHFYIFVFDIWFFIFSFYSHARGDIVNRNQNGSDQNRHAAAQNQN